MDKPDLLTPREIYEIDVINADKHGYDTSLKVALNFHSNNIASAEKKRNEWWDNIISSHGLDINKDYSYNRATCEITEKKESGK